MFDNLCLTVSPDVMHLAAPARDGEEAAVALEARERDLRVHFPFRRQAVRDGRAALHGDGVGGDEVQEPVRNWELISGFNGSIELCN